MIRAALISIIYKSSLDIAVGTVEASSPVSLMGADVERVMSTLQWVISTAPNIIQATIAIWILETRLGAICVAPVIFVLSEFDDHSITACYSNVNTNDRVLSSGIRI